MRSGTYLDQAFCACESRAERGEAFFFFQRVGAQHNRTARVRCVEETTRPVGRSAVVALPYHTSTLRAPLRASS